MEHPEIAEAVAEAVEIVSQAARLSQRAQRGHGAFGILFVLKQGAIREAREERGIVANLPAQLLFLSPCPQRPRRIPALAQCPTLTRQAASFHRMITAFSRERAELAPSLQSIPENIGFGSLARFLEQITVNCESFPREA